MLITTKQVFCVSFLFAQTLLQDSFHYGVIHVNSNHHQQLLFVHALAILVAMMLVIVFVLVVPRTSFFKAKHGT
jgi:hypothetical protein